MATGETAVRLRPPRNALDRRAVGWWLTQWLIAAVVVATVPGLLGLWITPARTWLWASAAALSGLSLLCAAVFPLWWFRVHRWEVTDEAVYVRTGSLWQEWRIAPMSRIQTVDTVRGPLERSFKLATVTVTTASSEGPVRIVGLDHEVAAELVAELTRVTQATPGDAT
ncbi:PH domain-containing protein [Streptomyces sp. NPDC048057]|uniref:PH domain-containing protein n=1 Tax=Streptomyces sp. NPDC048057 TaxID=3155628 RepID=UPI00340F6339